jgi:hypothetical protein
VRSFVSLAAEEGSAATIGDNNEKAPAVKAALLAGVAVLFLATGTAQAVEQLPSALLDHHWCFTMGADEGAPDRIIKDDNFDNCANRGGIRFWRQGKKWGYQLDRFEWRADCEITKINRVSRTYQVHSYCRAKQEMFVGDPLEGDKIFEIWQAGTKMYMRDIEK